MALMYRVLLFLFILGGVVSGGFAPAEVSAQACSEYGEGATCVLKTETCAGNQVPTNDCSTPDYVCCVPPQQSAPTCSSQGGFSIPSGQNICVGGVIVPASGMSDTQVCCVPPTCASLYGSCITSGERSSCTGTINTINDCASINPAAPYCCIAAENNTTCTLTAPQAGTYYDGTCTNVSSCTDPKEWQTGAECSAGQVCCYDPIEIIIEDGCTRSGGTCSPGCGDGQISNSSLFCPDFGETCCLPNPDESGDNTSRGGTGLVPCEGPNCEFCDFVELIKNVVDWLIGILGVIAAIMFIVSGLKLVTSMGDVAAKEKAKNMMINAAIGFMIVLAAWLLIDLLIEMLTKAEFAQTWNWIKCVN